VRRREKFKEAILHFDKGKYDKAIEIFEEIISNEPENHDAKYNLALCYMRKIGIDLQEEEKYVPEDKTDEEVYAIRAISLLNEVLEENPKDREVLNMIEGIKKVMDME
jgi:tetratricopeptide (TPR) repeat protein